MTEVSVNGGRTLGDDRHHRHNVIRTAGRRVGNNDSDNRMGTMVVAVTAVSEGR